MPIFVEYGAFNYNSPIIAIGYNFYINMIFKVKKEIKLKKKIYSCSRSA